MNKIVFGVIGPKACLQDWLETGNNLILCGGELVTVGNSFHRDGGKNSSYPQHYRACLIPDTPENRETVALFGIEWDDLRSEPSTSDWGE